MRAEVAADLEAARLLLTRPARVSAADAAEWLYVHWFHAETGTRRYPAPAAYAAATALAALFVDRPYTVARQRPDGLHVRLDSGAFRSAPGDHGFADPWTASGRLRVLDRNAEARGGWWHWWGAAWSEAQPDRVERVYLQAREHAEADFAAAFAAAAPIDGHWYIKLLTGAHGGGRRDSAVLFLPPGARDAPWLRGLLAEAAPLLDAGAPRFAQPLAHGAAWAEDPGGGESFGTWVCGLLAKAAPVASDPEAFARAVTAAGLDLDAPHRCAR